MTGAFDPAAIVVAGGATQTSLSMRHATMMRIGAKISDDLETFAIEALIRLDAIDDD